MGHPRRGVLHIHEFIVSAFVVTDLIHSVHWLVHRRGLFLSADVGRSLTDAFLKLLPAS